MESMRTALINNFLSNILLIRIDFVHQLMNYLISDKVSNESFATSLGKDWKIKETKIQANIAIIAIHGVLMRNPGAIEKFMFGAISTEEIKNQIAICLSDPNIDGIILDIDSPGGSLIGPPALAEFIYQSQSIKPILAYTSGQMCSAAMWIGSAANMRVAFPSAIVGSIGVWTEHVDLSAYYEKLGMKATIISSGRNKIRGAWGYPLVEEDYKYIQQKTDDAYSQFISAVSKYMNISSDKLVNEIGADIYFAEKAEELGLIDNVATFEDSLHIVSQMALHTDKEIETLKSAYSLNNDPVLNIQKINYEEVLQLSSGHCD